MHAKPLQADYIIAGAGASGLHLTDALLREPALRDTSILLIDRAPKTSNDRTWCFWEQGDNTLESIVFKRWSRLGVHAEGFSKVFDAAPYAYKMLRGVDFYRHMDARIAADARVRRVYGDVQGITQTDAGVEVTVDDVRYSRAFAFNSLPPPLPANPAHHNLLQHFLGWIIETEDDRFDPDTATLMDFQIDQAADTRFVYVLPLSPRSALVEFTVFSSALLARTDYIAALRSYIEQRLQIEEFSITHDEFGVIPMSDAPVAQRGGANIMNIGTAGGATKPSTGYTFLRAQRQAGRIAAALAATGAPFYDRGVADGRYRIFDSTLLNVLDKGRQRGADVFRDLFKNNPPALIFKFLDEDTTLAEDLRVMASVDIPIFTRALVDVLRR